MREVVKGKTTAEEVVRQDREERRRKPQDAKEPKTKEPKLDHRREWERKQEAREDEFARRTKGRDITGNS